MTSHQTAAALSSSNLAVVDTLGATERGRTPDQAAAPAPSSIEYAALSFVLDIFVSAASLFREVSSFCDSKGFPLRRE